LGLAASDSGTQYGKSICHGCPQLAKADASLERAAHKRAMLRRQRVNNGLEPDFDPLHRDLVLYAAALGQKQGRLPYDLCGFRTVAFRFANGDGSVSFFRGPNAAPICVALRNLDWSPAPAVEENLDNIRADLAAWATAINAI
jgi:hypothetical protein